MQSGYTVQLFVSDLKRPEMAIAYIAALLTPPDDRRAAEIVGVQSGPSITMQGKRCGYIR
jgi:hypothetical protein